jgi:VWFA-related protein
LTRLARFALAAWTPCSLSADPSVTVVAPEPGKPVTGMVLLRARLEPPETAPSVLRFSFSVGGRTICQRQRPPFECRWDAGPAPVANEIRASWVLRDGRRLSAQVRTGGPVRLDAVHTDVVHVSAAVTDESGRAVPGLTRDSFRVAEDRVAQTVTHFLGPDGAREVVVAIDVSASMDEVMPQVRRAVKVFLSGLRPADRVTLLAFNDNVFTLASRQREPADRLAAANRLSAWGSTALYDAILRSLDLLDAQQGRKALVVFTDGDDQASLAALEDVEKRSEVNDVPIYMIGHGREARVPELKRVLERLARVSGGRAFHIERPAQIEAAFAAIGADLESQYVLGYASTNGAHDSSWRRIDVSTGPGLRVRAREGYRAVPPEEVRR